MTRPRLLDLYAGAGGAAVGYHRAGFEVVGVDIVDQPNYPFEFKRMDALEITRTQVVIAAFDAIHASPPRPFATTASGKARKHHGANLIPATRDLLQFIGLPYVIENVEFARSWLINPVRYCGSSFGLDLRRHRLFESTVPLEPPPCGHGMTDDELSQAIPPAYTEHVGRQLMKALQTPAGPHNLDEREALPRRDPRDRPLDPGIADQGSGGSA